MGASGYIESVVCLGVCSLKNIAIPTVCHHELAGPTSMWRIMLTEYLTDRSEALWSGSHRRQC